MTATPGPYYVLKVAAEDIDRYEIRGPRVGKNSGLLIGSVNPYLRGRDPRTGDLYFAAADNAALISAAPDLLAFAEAAEGLVAWALDNGASRESTEALERMRVAAVKKAEGEL